jgi:hypothetical protein
MQWMRETPVHTAPEGAAALTVFLSEECESWLFSYFLGDWYGLVTSLSSL